MEDVNETGRIEAFSDGVFAVAITLLVLDIQPPHLFPLDDSHLFQTLIGNWPIYLAFIGSFATIGIMWINHHRLFTYIKRMDTPLLLLNLFLLAIIVFIPFPTSLLAQYVVYPQRHLAAMVYSGTCLFMALAFNLLWFYASHDNRLLHEKVDQQMVRSITDQYRFGPLLYLITFGIAWISAPLCIVLNLLLAIFFVLPGRKRQSPIEKRQEENDLA